MILKRFILALLSLVLIGSLTACGDQADTQSQGPDQHAKTTVMLDWVPNTNHTGLFVALEKGWYKEQGLDVEIIQPPEGGVAQLVAANKADFGVGYQEDITLARANDVPVVSIAAIIQHNTSGFASKKAIHINTPKDFEGKRYGGWGSPSEEAVIKAVMKDNGADFNQVEIFNVGQMDFFTVIERDADFTWIYYGWDGVEAEQRQLPLNVMMLKDLDPALDYYTPVLITNENTIAHNPDTVTKFLAAANQGYQFCIEHPTEAAEILLKYAPELDRELVVASQQWLSTEYQADAVRWGEQKRSVWKNYAQWLYDQKLLTENIDETKAFTNDFLPKQ